VAKFIGTDISVSINSVDLSDHANAVDISLEKDRVETTGFNATGTKEYLPGSAEEEFTVTFQQDFADGEVDDTLWPLYDEGTTFPFIIKATSAATSATNPAYTGNANLYEYHPIDAELGDVVETEVTFAITGGITRAVS
jgi:hypothetical protein